MGGIANKAWAAGWNVIRLNQRNCGETEHLSSGLYHSGLTNDPLHVMREIVEVDGIRAVAVAGYSLGGNLTLKLAGELGDSFPALKAVCAVSPTMDLALCVKALERRSNIAYEFNFVRRLKARMRRKAAIFPGCLFARASRSCVDGPAVRRGVHGAAPRVPRRQRLLPSGQRHAGHRSHLRTGADPHGRRRPIRACRSVSRVSVLSNPNVKVVVTPHGGHCAFIERGDGEYDGYWAEREIVRFVTSHL